MMHDCDRAPKASTERRTMTSAITGLSVADVRKCLAKLRGMWSANSQEVPMDLSANVWESADASLNVSNFAFMFVIGHHRKRHLKGKQCGSAEAP